MSQEPVCSRVSFTVSFFPTSEQTLYAGTIRFNILLGAIKPVSEVTQDEIVLACRNANILDFINSLPEFVVMSCLPVFPAINGKFEAVLTPKLVAKALSCPGVRNVCQMYCNPFQPH